MTQTSTVRGIAVLTALLAALPARAADPASFDIERFRASVDGTGGFAVTDPTTLPLGKFAAGLVLQDAIKPLVLERANGTREDLVSNRLTGVITGLIGLPGPLSLGVAVPVVLYQAGSLAALPPSLQPGPLGVAGMGDIYLTPRVSLMQDGGSGVDLALDATLAIPSGNGASLSGDQSLGGNVVVTVGKRLNDLRLLGQVGARLRGAREVVSVDVGSELTLRLAGAYDLKLGDAVYLPKQVLAEIDAGTLFSPFGAQSPGEWRIGARFCVADNVPVTLGAGGGLTHTYGVPLARITLAASFDPRACMPPDADSDGITDTADKCPTERGLAAFQGCPPPKVEDAPADTDKDGVIDADDKCVNEPGLSARQGCPAPDGDMDGVPDDIDRCPAEPGVEKHMGCPPPPPDADGDAIPDAQDACPDVAGISDFKGCPVPDKDADGILDADDKCPTEPGLKDRAGCPFRDSDKDGLEDSADRCPNEAGLAEKSGCPKKDDDGDGVDDDEDNCPKEKGTVANRGCKAKQLVVIRKDKVEILQKVQFANGKAAIDKKSFALLDQVAAVLVAHPEIPKIRVEGHTDNVGVAEKNKKLSQERADAVVAYLVKKGVAADRLMAVGFGSEQPIAPNLTAKGKEANRRVEFRIVEGERSTVVTPVDTKAAEQKAADEKKAAEQKAADEKKAAEQKAADEKKAAEQKAAEQKAADEKKAAEQKAADEKKAAEQKAADEKKAAEKKAEEKKPDELPPLDLEALPPIE